MEINDIVDFFNNIASSWDNKTIRNEQIISDILDLGEISEGKSVLDVACGTGVLFPDYLKRGTAKVLGVDVSEEMVKIANEKYNKKGIKVVCADIATLRTDEKFDCIMIHNAFPHFINPIKILNNLVNLLKKDGRLTVAHSMSRHEINACHKELDSTISVELLDENELANIMNAWLNVDVVISDKEKYIVSGKLKI